MAPRSFVWVHSYTENVKPHQGRRALLCCELIVTPVKAFFRSFHHIRGWILLFQSYIWAGKSWEETERHRNTRERPIFPHLQFHSSITPEQKSSSFRNDDWLPWTNHPHCQYYLNYGCINSGCTSVWWSVKTHKAITPILLASTAKIHRSLSTLALMNKIIPILFLFFLCCGWKAVLTAACCINYSPGCWLRIASAKFPQFLRFSAFCMPRSWCSQIPTRANTQVSS